ncbi:MAG: nitroreductase family protein [Gammaproteobacteria bacterium]
MATQAHKNTALKFNILPPTEMAKRAQDFYQSMATRRTVRDFDSKPVARTIIEDCLRAAGSAPSGANRQPWHFAVVATPELKQQIREGAETEEREFYARRAPQDWLDALAPLGTDADKPFLETAPYLIVIFGQKYVVDEDGAKHKNYYVTESASIATGLLIAALHQSGLATLTHTPSPMKFLNTILQRPASEKPLMILVVGYPAANTRVPDIGRKELDEISSFL